MKPNKKNNEKINKNKSKFSIKSLVFLVVIVFVICSMATSLTTTLVRTIKSISTNSIEQDKLKNTQMEVAEQDKKIDGLKSAEGAEAVGRGSGLVKKGEVPVQIQFAPDGTPINEDDTEEAPLFNPLNGLIGALAAVSIIVAMILIKKKRINLRMVESPAIEPAGLERRKTK